jgi:TolA-binding protein
VAAQKSDKSKAQNGKGGLMGLVAKLLGVVAISLGTLFFAAMFDIGHAGLIHTLAGPAAILVPLFAVLSIGAMFLTPKSTADLDEQEAQIAALSEFQSKMKSQILTLQNQMDSMSGQDVEALRVRNKELQEELDAIHQAEREKKRSVHLDPLVIAIGRAARVRDLADAARGGGQDNSRRVHVAGLADCRIDQRRTHGIEAHELLAQQETGHVEIVDHHVPEQPARALRYRKSAAAKDRATVMVTSSTAPISPAAMRARMLAKFGIEAAVEPGQERHARGLHHARCRRGYCPMTCRWAFRRRSPCRRFAAPWIRSKCVSVGVPITTASMSARQMASDVRTHHPRVSFFGKRVWPPWATHRRHRHHAHRRPCP